MSLMSHKSPILSGLSARRKHHIHASPADTSQTPDSAADNSSTDKHERPFGELKYDATTPGPPPAYKSIFSL